MSIPSSLSVSFLDDVADDIAFVMTLRISVADAKQSISLSNEQPVR